MYLPDLRIVRTHRRNHILQGLVPRAGRIGPRKRMSVHKGKRIPRLVSEIPTPPLAVEARVPTADGMAVKIRDQVGPFSQVLLVEFDEHGVVFQRVIQGAAHLSAVGQVVHSLVARELTVLVGPIHLIIGFSIVLQAVVLHGEAVSWSSESLLRCLHGTAATKPA